MSSIAIFSGQDLTTIFKNSESLSKVVNLLTKLWVYWEEIPKS
jgi:hypothetical protein